MTPIQRKLRARLNPNLLIHRTVWSTPQSFHGFAGVRSCISCKYFAQSWPKMGKCGNLRIMAAHGKAPQMRGHYYCNFYEEKEKENGKTSAS